MKRNIIKISVTVLSILILLSVFSIAFAEDAKTVVSQFDGNFSREENSGAAKAETAAVKIISTILNIIRTVGAAVAIIILIIIACKYLIASAGERADIKKYATIYILGALILFGASGIASIIQKFVSSNI